MDLQEFITQTLLSIRQGVINTNKEIDEKKYGTPFVVWFSNENKKYIEFDVAVMVSQEKGGKGGGSLKIAVANLDGEKDFKNIQEAVSRVKFSIKVENYISRE